MIKVLLKRKLKKISRLASERPYYVTKSEENRRYKKKVLFEKDLKAIYSYLEKIYYDKKLFLKKSAILTWREASNDVGIELAEGYGFDASKLEKEAK